MGRHAKARETGAPRVPSRRERGQGLVELVLTLPVLLGITFGVLEFGTLLDRSHQLAGLTREGANMASRGVSLDSVLMVTVMNGTEVGLDRTGGAVVSRVGIQNGVPIITEQFASAGYAGRSRIGMRGGVALPLQSFGLQDGRIYHVVEAFSLYRPFTPLDAFVERVVPDTLYDRAVF